MPSSNIDDEESDLQACPLPPVDIGEEGKTRNDTSVTSHGFILALESEVKKFFQEIGWFSSEVIDDFLDDSNTQIYTIRFTYDGEEMWMAHDATVNTEAASITVGDRGFQFIRKFLGDGRFSGAVVEILRGGKGKSKFCDGDEQKYTLI